MIKIMYFYARNNKNVHCMVQETKLRLQHQTLPAFLFPVILCQTNTNQGCTSPLKYRVVHLVFTKGGLDLSFSLSTALIRMPAGVLLFLD